MKMIFIFISNQRLRTDTNTVKRVICIMPMGHRVGVPAGTGGPDWVSCDVLNLLIAVLLVAPSGRPFAEERLLLDRRLETLRRILPDGAAAAADTRHVRELAGAAQLGRLETRPLPPDETRSPGVASYELTAMGGYDEIDRFFGRLALSHRLVDVETLTLNSAPESVIQLSATLRLPFWPPGARLPAPPETGRERPKGVSRPVLETYRRDQALALAKSEAIARWRRTRRNPRLFLSELSAVVRERAVVLGFASLGETFTVRGLAVGEGTVRGLESRFEHGFFRVSEFLMARQGACHRFEVHGTSPVAGPDAELPVPLGDPFVQDEAPCRVDRDPAGRIVVRGPTPSEKKPGTGPLTLRLRDVDFADVFQVVNLASGAGFIVDADVLGRVDLDVTRMSLAEILDLLRDKAKVEIEEPGPVRRVSRTPRPAAPPGPTGGSAASFTVKRADVRDILGVMTDIDPNLAALGPPGFLGRLSVWASGVPVVELRASVLAAMALVERVEVDRRILDRATGAGAAPVPVAGRADERRLTVRPGELAVLEFNLAGVASDGRDWFAFAYSPTGQLHTYRAGDHLADAIVRSIESTDVVLETGEGLLRIALPTTGK